MNHTLGARTNESGATNIWLILGIIFIVLTVGLGVAFGWALMNYFDQKDNVDTKVSAAVNVAVKKQADTDAAVFEKRDKEPNRLFAGPEDFGALSFSYPKTWSTYIEKDASTGVFQAYLNPGTVPPVNDRTQYALRVTIETKEYDKALTQYNTLVQTGALKSSTVKVNGVDSTRLEGNFTKDIRGSLVVFKIRDKTVTVRTDADTFKNDFNAVVASIKFNS